MTAHLDDPGTLVELFARTVRSHPNRPAVSDDHDRLTYAQLDRRSASAAYRLGMVQGTGCGDVQIGGTFKSGPVALQFPLQLTQRLRSPAYPLPVHPRSSRRCT